MDNKRFPFRDFPGVNDTVAFGFPPHLVTPLCRIPRNGDCAGTAFAIEFA